MSVVNLSLIQLRVSSKLKDPLRVAKESGVEKRLKDDAKQVSLNRLPLRFQNVIRICDMVKRNEADVGHIVFEILANTVFKFLFYIVFSIDKFIITLQPDVQL